MRIWWRQWRFSIFTKIVLTFLIVISPLYVFGAQINDWGAEIVKNEISKSLRSQIEFYSSSLEKEIDRMIRLQREYVNDDDLLALSLTVDSMSDYQRAEAIKRFQIRLGLMKQSSIYVEDATAYIPLMSRSISTVDLSRILEQTTVDLLKQTMQKSNSPIIQLGDRLYLRDYYPSLYVPGERNPIFVLEQEISRPALLRYLQQLSSYERGGAALMIKDWKMVHTANEDALQPISSAIQEQIVHAENAANSIDSFQDMYTQSLTIPVKKENYLTVFTYLPSLEATVLVYVPESEVMGPLEKYRIYLLLISIIALVVILLFAYWIFRIIHRPLSKLVRAFHKVETGNMQVMLHHKSNDEFHYLYERFNYMVEHLRTLIYEVYEQKIHAQQSELKQLQSQINPHFLYNSFYLLYRMTKAHDYDNATKFTKYLGDYFQYITRSGSEVVALEQEIKHVRAYAEIQSIRFADRIRVHFQDIPDMCKLAMVPRLILQPIVENAYQHGFDQMLENARLIIEVELKILPDGCSNLMIHVEDNGRGFTEQELKQWERKLQGNENPDEITGMLNVHRRLQLKYGPDSGLILAQGAAGGLRVTIKLPGGET